MAVATNSIPVYRGDDWSFSVFVTQTTDEGITAPYDPTGATLAATVAGVAVTPTIVSAATGKLNIAVARADTASLEPGAYAADIQTTKSGIRTTIKKFQVVVLEDQTI